MSTQGLVSIVDRHGGVHAKIIAGCNGFQAKTLAASILRERLTDPVQLFERAKLLRFGCQDCLVVMTADGFVFRDAFYPSGEDHTVPGDLLTYGRFQDPAFNPRWPCGTVEHLEIISF